MSEDHTPSLSDEDEDELDLDASNSLPSVPAIQGYLSKWTNYLHGWQERWVVLREGTLSYYKSEFDTAFGCRGSISVAKATMQPHDFDECRFDVSVNDCMYYLRAKDTEERQKWVDALEAIKAAESGYGSESSLRKGGSMLSLTSVTSLGTTPSTSSFKKGRGLREKLLELGTFRDIVGRQIDTLQSYFDACTEFSNNMWHGSDDIRDHHHDEIFGSNDALDGHHDTDDEMDELSKTPTPASMAERLGHKGAVDASAVAALAKGIDFRGEAITFKATTAGILATLEHCLDIMNKREDYWQRRLEKETDKRKKAEAAVKDAVTSAKKQAFLGGPDFEEGPHCALNEEEFFDAMEIELERQDEQAESSERNRRTTSELPPHPPPIEEPLHRLSYEVTDKIKENLTLIRESVDENWYLVHEDGDLKVYRRDYEEGGIILDPMKATHTVKGVTAREMAHYFFDKDTRLDWDTTIDYFKVLETLSDSTLIFHQVLKRIWPSSQRDFLFVSHIKDIIPSMEEEKLDNEVGYAWMVNNFSIDHPDVPTNKFVRVTCNVAFFCQTIIEPREEGEPLTRDHISCKITYSANVNPGGWAPPSVVRALSKREYPKFLRKISFLCQAAYQEKEIAL